MAITNNPALSMNILHPLGPIGVQEKHLIIVATIAMLIVVIPVIAMTIGFAWRYRESNTKATYAPDWHGSTKIEVMVWVVPCLIVAFLGWVCWQSTHDLDPYKPLDAQIAQGHKPITIQAVSLDWKWLFIYPDQHVASVNELAIPADTPVEFDITSDTVMNVLFIPRLGTQIYAMAGMRTELHLLADKPGIFGGLSANFSGPGFADMNFNTLSLDPAGFQAWVAKAAAAPDTLNEAAFHKLQVPSADMPVTYFSHADPSLFARIIAKHEGPPSPLPDMHTAAALATE